MVKYSREPEDAAKVAKARGSALRVHYKNAVEVANAVRGMELTRAKAYLNNVLQHKEAVPFTHFKGGRGRHAQVSRAGGELARSQVSSGFF
jgi:large subunit ribosomal protein L17e